MKWDRITKFSHAFTQAARGDVPSEWAVPLRGDAVAPVSRPTPSETPRPSGGEAPPVPAAVKAVGPDDTAASPEKPRHPATSTGTAHMPQPQGVTAPVNSPTNQGGYGMRLRPPEPPPGRQWSQSAPQEQPLGAPPAQPSAAPSATLLSTASHTPQPSLAFRESPPIAQPWLSLALKPGATVGPLTLGQNAGTPGVRVLAESLEECEDVGRTGRDAAGRVEEPSVSTSATDHHRQAPEPGVVKAPGIPANVSMEIRDLLAAFGSDLLAAFGKAMTGAHDRRANETLDMVLTAQHEQTALILQGMADQREYYGATLERAIIRLTRDVAPESFINIGEVFQKSAAEISSALRCGEHMQLRVLETLREISASLKQLLTQVDEFTTAPKVQNPPEVRTEKPAEAPNLRVLPTGTGERKRAGNVLERLGDDDEKEVT